MDLVEQQKPMIISKEELGKLPNGANVGISIHLIEWSTEVRGLAVRFFRVIDDHTIVDARVAQFCDGGQPREPGFMLEQEAYLFHHLSALEEMFKVFRIVMRGLKRNIDWTPLDLASMDAMAQAEFVQALYTLGQEEEKNESE